MLFNASDKICCSMHQIKSLRFLYNLKDARIFEEVHLFITILINMIHKTTIKSIKLAAPFSK